MPLKATIFKADLQISDLDRNYYKEHALTIARHPSETDERMMVRVLVFALHADEEMAFTRGLSTENEPDLWYRNVSGEIECWIELGQPDEKRIRKACARAGQVFVYTYGGRSAEIWWEHSHAGLDRFEKLSVINLPQVSTHEMAKLVQRNMQLQCTIQDRHIWLSDGETTVAVTPVIWKLAA